MERKRVLAPKIEETIQFDGRFGDPAWQKAAAVGPFYLNDGSRPETESTTVRICHNGRYLYLGWTLKDSDIQATYTEHDSDLWDEEVAEFFAAPHDPGQYFELQWNPLGTVFDAIITNTLGGDGLSKGISGDRSWHAKGMVHKVTVDGKPGDPSVPGTEWRVEAAVPFADLGLPGPSKGDVWRVNFYRYNRTAGKNLELCAWNPTLTGTFHEPNRFGELEFG